MGLVVLIACGNGPAVLVFTLRKWFGTGDLGGRVRPSLAARGSVAGCSDPGRELGEVGEAMQLASPGELE